MIQILRKEGWKLNPNDKVVNGILKLCEANNGECPCVNPGETREDRLCPCKEYRENDICHCTLYVKASQEEKSVKKKMRIQPCLTSNSTEGATPNDFFAELNEKYHFNLDPCATDENAKCEKYFTIKDDGLTQDGAGHNVFCNPPYGREISKGVEKCYNESRKANTLVVMLIPARTDTKYFHKWIYGKAEIEFIEGRLHFNDSEQSAPFPSMLVIYK